MPRYFDFDADIADSRGEPVEFSLGGERFEVLTPLPAWPYLRLVTDISEDQRRSVMAQAVRQFLVDLLPDADEQRFDAAIKQSGISTDGLIALSNRIAEEASGRPTEGQDDSPSSPSENGAAYGHDARSLESMREPVASASS